MNKPTMPGWLRSAIFYEVYPQSFLDTNGDGIGDLEGIIRKLDYIASLGCNALWLNPCFVSPFGDAGYDVADFYRVAPRYGSNEDLVRLFREGKKRGVKICLDLVAGHTSWEHPWFQESCRAEPNPHTNWYVWTDSVWDHGGSDFVRGRSERNGNYLSNFFHFQPALNYGYANPTPGKAWQLPVTHPDVQAVRAELVKILRFWLDLGADGFRVDMAGSLVKNDPDHRETMALWREVRAMFDRDYPEAALMSEWSHHEKAIAAGFHIDFMLPFGDPPAYMALARLEKGRDLSPFTDGGHSYFDRAGRGDINAFLEPYLRSYNATRGQGFITIPTGNHDVTRLAMRRTPEEIELVFVMVMTMPGVPFIYYGDEIGLRQAEGIASIEGGYDRTGARAPMQWDSSENAGFSTVADAAQLYLPIDPDADRPTVAAQEADAGSLLARVRALGQLRREHPALCADGEFTPLHTGKQGYPFVYRRALEGETFLIALNPADRAVEADFGAEVSVPDDVAMLHGHGAQLNISPDGRCRLRMEPLSCAVYQVVRPQTGGPA